MNIYDVDVSIIIPSTGKRKELILRAIKSALIERNNINIEIIIIFNGSFIEGINENDYLISNNICCFYLNEGNVSKARNFGQSIAKGKLIRFLDDDDFLYPDIAYEQYQEMLIDNEIGMSTYGINLQGENGKTYQTYTPPEFDDFLLNSISEDILAVPLSMVFRREFIKDIKWDEECNFPEDQDFVRKLAGKRYVKWVQSKRIVGVWFQHNNERLSVDYVTHWFVSNKYNSLMNLKSDLENTNRLNAHIKKEISQVIWHYIHLGLFLSPIFWIKASHEARKLDKSTRPNTSLYNFIPKFISPIVIEFILIPKRFIFYYYKILLIKIKKSTLI